MDYITTRKQIETMLIKKAAEDEVFKKLLFSDAAEALKSIGVSLPGEFNLKVIQESPNELILTIPALPVQGELSELELLNAVGGTAVTRNDLS